MTVPDRSPATAPPDQANVRPDAVIAPPDAANVRPDATTAPPDPATAPPGQVRRLGPHVDVDRDGVERGLGSLVLTIIELLRQLMERQALRRIDQGDLTEDQIEKVGATLMALEEQMTELREHFGLSAEDLNLDLGPLGPLLPRE